MSAWRRTRAALVLGLVSGAFWAVVLPVVTVVVLIGLGRWSGAQVVGSLGTVAWIGGLVGALGGVLYAGMIAGLGRRREGNGLGLGPGAVAGALAGALLYLAFQVAYAPVFGVLNLVSTQALLGTMLFGGLGAATGALIMVVARRGALPRPPDRPRLEE